MIKSHFSLHLQVLLEWHRGGGIGETQRKWVNFHQSGAVQVRIHKNGLRWTKRVLPIEENRAVFGLLG